ncbi:hypothetical protein [Streptomyces abikoensis]
MTSILDPDILTGTRKRLDVQGMYRYRRYAIVEEQSDVRGQEYRAQPA